MLKEQQRGADIAAVQRSAGATRGTHGETVVAVAWSVLLVLAVGGPRLGPAVAEHAALCATTALGAASCAWRALRRPGDRLGWALVGAGLAGYAAGFAAIFGLHTGAGPLGLNVSDWLSLPLYPLTFAGLVTLGLRRALGGAGRLLPTGPGTAAGWSPALADRWSPALASALDGIVAALALGAVVVVGVGRAHAALFHGGSLRMVYALAYPVGSLGLLAAVLVVVALGHWRLTPRWGLLLGGFGALAVGDVIYAFEAAARAFHFGTWLDAVYAAGPALAGLAAWAGDEDRPSARRSSLVLAIPAAATLLALAVLVSDHARSAPTLAVVLAGAGIALSIGRTALFVREERRYERARHESLTDDLTGLANRRALERVVGDRVTAGSPTCLLLVDLDGFKEVNDTLGHGAGDELLVVLAGRLQALGGQELVARVGGDEFAVVLHAEAAEDAAAHAAAVGRVLQAPATIDGGMVAVGASIGWAGTTGLAATGAAGPGGSGELLRRADVAMYRAKALRTHVEAWDPSLDLGTRQRLETMAALRSAIADPEQIVVHYQPQFDARTLGPTGLEALARWQHPTRGLLGPGEWLPAVEQAGLLTALTDRVLDASLAEVARLVATGRAIPVSVNASAPDLLDLSFPDRVAAAITRHGVDPSLLRIEITETVVMTDPDRVVRALGCLRELGIGLSLDDYGTGLSSLSYLQTLPVDELKIDRSFVRRITEDPASAMIVASTIDLAHALRLVVVAEGVEDRATLEVLADADCDTIQGFLLGRPQAAEDLRLAGTPAALGAA